MSSLLNESKPDPPTDDGGSILGLVTMGTPKHKKEAALTSDELDVLLEIEAASMTPVREGLDLVAVLDVSGSMKDGFEGGGQKMSKMQTAMKFLISKLAPVDRLSIVTFASKEEKRCGLRSMKANAKPALQDIVKGLVADGGTNISAGLKTALDIVRSRKYDQGRSANIFLLTDGRQNNDDAKLIDTSDVPVYTFGIGKDADCELLSAIASNSRGGTFSTVKDGAELTQPFANLLGGTLTVVAQDVVLTLLPTTENRGLEKMAVVRGSLLYEPEDGPDGTIIIKFGNLFRQEKRKVVVKMTLKDATVTPPVVPPRPSDDDDDDDEEEEDEEDKQAIAAQIAAAAAAKQQEEYFVNLARASLTYTARGKQSTNGQADKLITIKRTPTPTSAIDSDTQEVLTELARLQHAVLIGKARELADKRNLSDARDKVMDALNNVENIVVDDGGKTADMLRQEAQHLLDLMKTQELYDSQRKPYALACESSHGCQRYAGRGDGCGIRTFCTGRMDTYQKQADEFLADSSKLPPTAQEDTQQEVAANPTAAFSPELAAYLMTAIEALQAIHKIITAPTTKAK
ncbi:unnamed protein product [Urochloa humidicola]